MNQEPKTTAALPVDAMSVEQLREECNAWRVAGPAYVQACRDARDSYWKGYRDCLADSYELRAWGLQRSSDREALLSRHADRIKAWSEKPPTQGLEHPPRLYAKGSV